MKRTIYFKNHPKIIATSTIAGPKESNGSISNYFEVKLDDDMFGEDTFEKAETKMLYTVIKNAIKRRLFFISTILLIPLCPHREVIK